MNILDKARKRDAEAFEILMRGELPGLYRIARTILDNDEDAADAIQEATLKCWLNLKKLRNDDFFKTWLTRILINECNTIIRNRRKTVSLDDIPEIPYEDPEAANGWQEITKKIEEKYRTVIEMFYVEEMSVKQIAKALIISEENVRIRLSRGRKQLKQILGDE